jgi:hypothetical protein
MKSKATKFNYSALPEAAKREMAIFYKVLKIKYGLKKSRKKKPDAIDAFFDQYQIDMDTFKFNREETHERR